ncbi:NAD(P)-binding Rossmann-fold containing protein-14 [Coleophoma crateriformis]|uniref:NAD(P)-binding Rossmann-fold containing protein-14 n=1 Tax=Coleophoma crateriformis TaxID=565419 RepID=A0A3D8T9X5_9HELO|nr:NAD(P)-binding Rossmann-fold containing protein-14 [Coleophoma crateriformis]
MPLGHFPLNGKIAVVTGAGSGINLSFAKLAIEQGARVVIADLKLTKEGEAFVKETNSRSVVFTKCDVTKRADLENLVQSSLDAFQDVPDVWVAGAGVFEPSWSNFWDDTEDDGYSQVDINVTHPMKLSRIAIRSLLGRNKKGVILCVASLAGFQGTFSAPLYCATKHAVIGFVRSLAELERLEGIKVVGIAPGLVRTPLWTDYPEKMEQFGYTMASSITAEDVAKAMADAITDGKVLGGLSMSVSTSGTRLLGTWNIEAPKEDGTSVPKEVIERNYAPIITTMKKERSRL